jgi:hypothetical protein
MRKRRSFANERNTSKSPGIFDALSSDVCLKHFSTATLDSDTHFTVCFVGKPKQDAFLYHKNLVKPLGSCN